MKKHKPLVIGNWKMNPATLSKAEKLWTDIQSGLKGRKAFADVAIAPPLPFITELQQLAGPQKVEFVSQDVSHEEGGAHTGEVSVNMLRSLKVHCSIIGHSERRQKGETDELINKKLHALLDKKSTAVLCIGERERDGSGEFFSVIEDQLQKALHKVAAADMKRIVIAYEPVWAIGSGKSAVPNDVQEMKLFIQKALSDLYSRELAENVRVLYGGSVTADNAEELLREGAVNGFLIGGASLEPKQFVSIVKIADQYARMV